MFVKVIGKTVKILTALLKAKARQDILSYPLEVRLSKFPKQEKLVDCDHPQDKTIFNTVLVVN